jgi:hypothetical protein
VLFSMILSIRIVLLNCSSPDTSNTLLSSRREYLLSHTCQLSLARSLARTLARTISPSLPLSLSLSSFSLTEMFTANRQKTAKLLFSSKEKGPFEPSRQPLASMLSGRKRSAQTGNKKTRIQTSTARPSSCRENSQS